MAILEKAFADWPKTAVLKDGSVHVTGKYVSAQLDSSIPMLAGLGGGIAAIWGWAAGGDFGSGVVTGLAGAAIVSLSMRIIFASRVDVKVYPDLISVRRGFGYKNYSRAMPIEFRIEQHQRAVIERGEDRTFREAIEAVMQYGEKRVALAGMPQKKLEMARALVIRLQNVCDSIDAAMAMASSDAGRSKPGFGEFGPAPDIR